MVNDVWSSLTRIMSLPFSQVGLGQMIKEKNKAVACIEQSGSLRMTELFFIRFISSLKFVKTISSSH